MTANLADPEDRAKDDQPTTDIDMDSCLFQETLAVWGMVLIAGQLALGFVHVRFWRRLLKNYFWAAWAQD